MFGLPVRNTQTFGEARSVSGNDSRTFPLCFGTDFTKVSVNLGTCASYVIVPFVASIRSLNRGPRAIIPFSAF